MANSLNTYRMSEDIEPEDTALSALMHEVAVDAAHKSAVAAIELRKTTRRQISEALAREGFAPQ